jgi:hypothetical protein
VAALDIVVYLFGRVFHSLLMPFAQTIAMEFSVGAGIRVPDDKDCHA